MKVSGFTFVRNAVRHQFPVIECIRSVLPMVDEFVVAVGESDDGTEDLIRSIGDPRIFVVPSRWNPNLKTGGFVLAQQTNVALFSCTGVWAVYIQADEAIHERDHAHLRKVMEQYADDDRVDSLSLHRMNFVGDYRTVYNPADDLCVRIVKPHRFVLSRGDAAGFTVHPKFKERGRRITTIDTGTPIFHYMDIRTPEGFLAKNSASQLLWQEHGSRSMPSFDEHFQATYARPFLKRYEGSHAAPLSARIAAHGYAFDIDSPKVRSKLSRGERKQIFKEFLARRVHRSFRVGAGSARLVGVELPTGEGGPLTLV